MLHPVLSWVFHISHRRLKNPVHPRNLFQLTRWVGTSGWCGAHLQSDCQLPSRPRSPLDLSHLIHSLAGKSTHTHQVHKHTHTCFNRSVCLSDPLLNNHPSCRSLVSQREWSSAGERRTDGITSLETLADFALWSSADTSECQSPDVRGDLWPPRCSPSKRCYELTLRYMSGVIYVCLKCIYYFGALWSTLSQS